MKSWKTTVSGYIGSAAMLVLALAGAGVAMPKWAVVTAGFVAAGGIAGIGSNAKDASVHSTAEEVQASTVSETKQAIAAEKVPVAETHVVPLAPSEIQK
jgi:uncharacterized protein (DUF2336 family)